MWFSESHTSLSRFSLSHVDQRSKAVLPIGSHHCFGSEACVSTIFSSLRVIAANKTTAAQALSGSFSSSISGSKACVSPARDSSTNSGGAVTTTRRSRTANGDPGGRMVRNSIWSFLTRSNFSCRSICSLFRYHAKPASRASGGENKTISSKHYFPPLKSW